MEKKRRGLEHKRLLVIASNYQYSVQRIKQLKREESLSLSQKEILNSYEKYVLHIRSILGEFNLLEQSILAREYFEPFPKGWWITIYPRSTFYRIRLETSKKFLELM